MLLRMLVCLLLLAPLGARAARVAVVQSDDLEPYTEPVPAFLEAVDASTVVLNLHGRRSEADAVAKRLQKEDPDVVFALGAKAAWTVRQHLPDTPLIYAMVLDPERYGIPGRQALGVQATTPPALYLSQFVGFFPEVKRIGVLRGPLATEERMTEMREAAERLGLELEVARVGSRREARVAFQRLAEQVDAVWLQPDREILTAETFRWFTEEARRRRLPLLVETDNMVRAGALFAVVPDPAGLGRQVAGLTQRLLEGAAPAVIGEQRPDDVLVVLNLRTVEHADIEFDPLLLDFVDVVVE